MNLKDVISNYEKQISSLLSNKMMNETKIS